MYSGRPLSFSAMAVTKPRASQNAGVESQATRASHRPMDLQELWPALVGLKPLIFFLIPPMIIA